MPCYQPKLAWRLAGEDRPVFNRSPGMAIVKELKLPCGSCVGCRQGNGGDWMVRICHEASLYKESCFLTVTLDPANMPSDWGLHVEHCQKFIKDLRNWIVRHYDGRKIRVFYIGEYGDQTLRPHYHLVIFNFDFPDKTYWAGQGELTRYKSQLLDRIWGRGLAELGSVTPASAAYIGSYVLKKQNSAQFDYLYLRHNSETGESWYVSREFAHMSNGGGGIGAGFLAKFESDLLPRDTCVFNGRERPVPKYYSRRFKQTHPEEFELVAARREADGVARAPDNTPERLAVKAVVAKARQALKQRDKI